MWKKIHWTKIIPGMYVRIINEQDGVYSGFLALTNGNINVYDDGDTFGFNALFNDKIKTIYAFIATDCIEYFDC